MRVLCAPDSFKGSLTASAAAAAMAKGIKLSLPQAEVVELPLSDGGEGLVETLTRATGGSIIKTIVVDPLGRPVDSRFGVIGKTAVIEMAAASGLLLIKERERNPMNTTTFGTGQLIKAALDWGCRRIIIGIGGSATNDGGLGVLMALGAKFSDEYGNPIEGSGRALTKLKGVDLSQMDERLHETEILAACDVDNPLTGPQGAAFVYGPQKGATPAVVKELDRGLRQLAQVIREECHRDVEGVAGSGAAGGLGAGLMAFLGAKLESGVKLVLDTVNIKDQLKGVQLVLTGEGRLDTQTAFGKVPLGVAREAEKMGIPAVALAGNVEAGINFRKEGLVACFSIINRPMQMAEAIENAFELLQTAAGAVACLFFAGGTAKKAGK